MLYFARWKVGLIVLLVVAAIATVLPNFFSEEQVKSWPGVMPQKQVVLGLDLRGGAHLLFEIDREKLIKDRTKTLLGDIRQILRTERIGATSIRVDGVKASFSLRDAADADKAREALRPVTDPIQAGLLGQGSVSEVEMSDDGTKFTLSLTDEGIAERLRSALQQTREVLLIRLDETGTTEPTVQVQGEDRILVQVPGANDPQRIIDIIGPAAKMTFHLLCPEGTVGEARRTRPPPGCEIAEASDEGEAAVLIDSRARLSGEDLVDAQAAFDSQSNQPIVTFRFNSRGGAIFAELTTANVGRPFAVVLDDKVITAPVIQTPIIQGNGQISGNFTVETANDLAVLLRAGSLPADLSVIEQRSVGPSLGQDSIDAGKNAALIGMVAVIVFMIAVYGLFGVFANIALFANIFLIFGIITMMQATLTLPGIAGIVLTIGMAVDANVLIFERIREEVRLGRTAINAIEAGFSRALATILDANITTLIAAAALFALGSGPIRGFAVTLVIGIMTTIFTAFLMTRMIVALWVQAKRPKVVPI
jgi:protein-export membrane protein SecD